MGPAPVLQLLAQWGLTGDRLHLATEQWSELAGGLAIHAVTAAHPLIERDTLGNLRYVGYVIEHRARRLYMAGYTRVVQELIYRLDALKPLATAVIHVNRHNFCRAHCSLIC